MNLEQFLLAYEEEINNIFDEAELPKRVRDKIIGALSECFGIFNLPVDNNDLLSIISTLAEGSYEIVNHKAVSIRKNAFIKKIDHEIQFYVDEDLYQDYIKTRKSNK